MSLPIQSAAVEEKTPGRRGSLRIPSFRASTSACSSLFPLAIVAIAFLGSISAIRFVTLDDRWYAAWVWSDSWVATAYQFAIAHGRFPKPSSYTFFVPYLFDSAWAQAGIRLSSILVSALIAGNLLQRILRVRGSAVLSTLFFFAFAQNSFEHNLFVAYPLAWELSWICWMLGLLGLMVAIERKSLPFALVGAAIWLFGLQEGFVAQTMIFLALVYSAWRTEKRAWIYLSPYAIGLFVWLVVWLAWRSAHPSTYAGSQLRIADSITDAARTVLTLSIGGMPMASWLQGSWRFTWESFVGSLTALSAIKALAVFAGAMKLLERARVASALDNHARVAFLAFALLVMAFLPNLLVGLTPKYQEWVRLGSHAYVYSHFSYFAWIALGTVCLCAVVHRCPSNVLTCVFALSAAVGSLLTDASNSAINRAQEQYGRRGDTMLTVMKSDAFSAIPNGAGIWMSDSSISGSESGDAEYWQYVVKARTGKNLTFTPDPAIAEAAPGGTYYMYLYDEPETRNQYVVLAPLDSSSDSGSALSGKFLIVSNSPNRSINVRGVLTLDGERLGEISANGRSAPKLFAGAFSISAVSSPDKYGVDVVTVSTSKPAQVQTIGVDFARNPASIDAPLQVVPGLGFYGWETDGLVRWNWSTLDAELEVRSKLQRKIPVIVEFSLVGGDSRTIIISTDKGVEMQRLTIDGAHPGHVKIPLTVEQGASVIRLHSDGSALHEPDTRKLAFQLRNLELHLTSLENHSEAGADEKPQRE